MLVAEAVSGFLKGYFSTHIRQEKTKAAYLSDTAQFVAFFGGATTLEEIGHVQIESWAHHMRQRSLSPATIRRKIVVAKLLFAYWMRNGQLDQSPFWRVRIEYGRGTVLPRSLSIPEMMKFLNESREAIGDLDDRSTSIRRLRDAAIIELFFATGIRVGEMSALNVEDISLHESSTRIKGKGNRERLAFIVDREALRVIKEYLDRRGPDSAASPLFLNRAKNRLSPQGIANVVTNYRKRLKIDRHVTPHMFRHTVATMLLRNGVDIRVVQEFLGHASIVTTQRYTSVSKEHMVRELQARHPTLGPMDQGSNNWC